MNEKEKELKKKEIKDALKDMFLAIKVMKLVADEEAPGMGEEILNVVMEEIGKMRSPALAAVATRKAMISQPMAGLGDNEIEETRNRALAVLGEKGYTVINTLFTDEWYSRESMKQRGVEQVPLCFLAKSLENMSLCHAAYFCKGWENARGCRIEHEAAKAYGLEIIYEEEVTNE